MIEYRRVQFDKVGTAYSIYNPKIKIIKPNGETDWMDISEEELAEIRVILCEK